MRAWGGATLAGAAILGVIGGWWARDYVGRNECSYTANGYKRLNEDLSSFTGLPLEQVNAGVLLNIQRCWAANPYGGPQHVLDLVDARKTPNGGYYAVFEPLGITDVQLAFRVEADGQVTQAYQLSTFHS